MYTKPIVAAFQSWNAGNSSIYFAEGLRPKTFSKQSMSVEEFIKRHHESGTFARLHTFTNADEALIEWYKMHNS